MTIVVEKGDEELTRYKSEIAPNVGDSIVIGDDVNGLSIFIVRHLEHYINPEYILITVKV